MAYFSDTDHLYRVFDALFTKLSSKPDVAQALLAGKFVLRFRYKEPAGQITIDLREGPISWQFDEADIEPDLEMIQSADTAHLFWLGKLSVPGALARREVVSRGPVAKALKLLPALKPAYPLYAEVLEELGEEALLEPLRAAEARKANQGTLERLGLPSGLVELFERGRTELQRVLPSGRARRPLALVGSSIPPLPVERHEKRDGGEDAQTTEDAGEQRSVPAELDELALKREMLARMQLIRGFEERLSKANARGEIPTEAIHLSIGQEATAVGVCFALRSTDVIATTHRGHGHMLAKGADLDGMMAELLGKASGLCGGKGGSMHVTDAAVGAIGANGIVGASPLIASGAAHSAQLCGSDKVAVAFLGDGATNQGMFHEALNFASVLDLPVLFVVENNLYGEFTPVERHCRVDRIADRAAAYGMQGITVDGNDVWAVYEATQKAVETVRRGEGPILLEALTYRWHGHMEGEDVAYRPEEEIQAWKERCPIKAWRGRLTHEKIIDADIGEELDRSTEEALTQAFDRAEKAPEPPADSLLEDIFAPEPRALVEPGSEPAKGDREITCSQALFEALSEELERDQSTYLLGEDVSTGGYFSVTVGLVDQFGPTRVVDTPISEYAIVGSAVGSAMAGSRPIAEILFSDFLTTCMDPLVNQAAKLRYMSGGQYRVPMVVRTPGGGGLGMAAQHSQSLEALLTGVAGLIVLAPATPFDAKGLLKSAIRSQNPVVFFENKLLYATTGPVPETDYTIPFGVADIKRTGKDATVVSIGAALVKVLEAAEALSRDGIEIEVVDLRSLVPLDMDAVLRSLDKTGRLITVEDGALFHGFGGELVARSCELAFDRLLAPPRRVAGADVPIPYNSSLENAALPDAGSIERAVRATLG